MNNIQAIRKKMDGFMKDADSMRALLSLLLCVAILGMGSAYYFYAKYRAVRDNPNAEVQKETAGLLSAVGKLIELPEDEIPNIAVISDKEKLREQAFFKSAENGDVLLAYTKSMKAILYRPRTNKIIEVALIDAQGALGGAQSVRPTDNIKIAYYNGTPIAGLAGSIEKTVRAQFGNTETVAISDAAKTDYKKTLVVDVSSKYSAEAATIARLLSTSVGALPVGEVRPDADILIVGGK